MLTVDVRAPRSSIKIVQPGRSEKGTWTWKVVRWAALACGGARGQGPEGVVVGC